MSYRPFAGRLAHLASYAADNGVRASRPGSDGPHLLTRGYWRTGPVIPLQVTVARANGSDVNGRVPVAVNS